MGRLAMRMSDPCPHICCSCKRRGARYLLLRRRGGDLNEWSTYPGISEANVAFFLSASFFSAPFGSAKRKPNPRRYSRAFSAIVAVVDVPVADEKATLGFVGWGALEVHKTGVDAGEADSPVVAASAVEAKLGESGVEKEGEKEEEMGQDEDEEEEEEEEGGATTEADADGGEAPL